MPKKCAACGKGQNKGFAVSHSQRKTKRRWLPNLQKVKVQQGNQSRRVYVCTRCLRAGKVQRAI